MTEERVWAHYLRDDAIAFRPPEEEDAERSAAWYEGTFPLSTAQALKVLRKSETVPWGNNPKVRLICGRIDGSEVVGGVVIDREGQRVDDLKITPSRFLEPRDRHDIATRILRVLTRWLIEEVAVQSIVVRVPADHQHLMNAAESLGFRQTARYREHELRPHGFVDLLVYQLLNPNWTLPRPERSDHA